MFGHTEEKAARLGGLVVCLRKAQDNWAELRFSLHQQLWWEGKFPAYQSARRLRYLSSGEPCSGGVAALQGKDLPHLS